MTRPVSDPKRGLAWCHGFVAVASDGPVGEIERPLFPPDQDEPDYLIVRVGNLLGRKPVVATGLVESVDLRRKLVFLRGSGAEIIALPEHLPLAI